MSDVTQGLLTSGKTWTGGHSEAWEDARCPHCGAAPLYRVAGLRKGTADVVDATDTRWLRCPACKKGSGSASPPVPDHCEGRHDVHFPGRCRRSLPRWLSCRTAVVMLLPWSF